jgi:hypothetical protein
VASFGSWSELQRRGDVMDIRDVKLGQVVVYYQVKNHSQLVAKKVGRIVRILPKSARVEIELINQGNRKQKAACENLIDFERYTGSKSDLE